MAEAIVEFEKVVFSYNSVEVLHEISYALRRGEIVGLLGPNGAGKSTTIKIIAGILAQESGSVCVAGLPLPEQAVEVKQRIGYVPENAMLFESLEGQEFLELAGRLHGVEEEKLQSRIRDILETFGLTSERVSRLDTYSKGMRQKILIAAALLHNPDLVLLDEPLSGLDVNATILVKDLIAALAGEGKTILYSSHVLDVVEKICDRVLIIQSGQADCRRDRGRIETIDRAGDPRRCLPLPHPRGGCAAWRGTDCIDAAVLKVGEVDRPGGLRHLREKISAVLRPILRGPRATRLLVGLGIDARRYWLLMDLFGTLAQRREMFQQLGRDGVTLEIVSWIYTAISALFTIGMVVSGVGLASYLAIFVGFTLFLLSSLLVAEVSNSLLNPVEALLRTACRSASSRRRCRILTCCR